MPKKKRELRDRARTPEAKGELRKLILNEATRLFLDVGYSEFSMRKLAQRIGYTATMIYSYFQNKDDLLFEVISNGWEEFAAYMVTPDGDAVDKLKFTAKRYLDFAFQNPELYKLMFMHRPAFLFDLSEEKVKLRQATLREIARQIGQTTIGKDYDAKSLDQAANLLWAQIHGLASLVLAVPLYDEKWARTNLDFLIRGLEPVLREA